METIGLPGPSAPLTPSGFPEELGEVFVIHTSDGNGTKSSHVLNITFLTKLADTTDLESTILSAFNL